MMEARALLRDALQADGVLPAKYTLLPYPDEPDSVPHVTVVLAPQGIEPEPTMPLVYWRVPCAVYVLVGTDLDPAAREDLLEAAVPLVLAALDKHEFLGWSGVERTTVNAFHAYKINAFSLTERQQTP
ncbi:hypothetical protein [Promicromonospora kroppenstedtii]|uniref:hypothetical protein n=1 Tax=Promicromonospora kroppenstedtii TaxID=440482 RepID=UPI0004AF9A11|nr:hypothetical protein [Promicromonospora kroppenstedtii]